MTGDRWTRTKAQMCDEARSLAGVVRSAGEIREEDAAKRLGIEVDGRGVCVRRLVFLANLASASVDLAEARRRGLAPQLDLEGSELIEEVDVSADLDTDRWLLRWAGPTEQTAKPRTRRARSANQLELF